MEGTSWLTGVSGLFPESYTQLTAESDAWTLHKKIALNQLATLDTKISQKKESKPSTSDSEAHHVTSTTDETKFTIEAEQPDEKEVIVGKKLYENVLELKEQASEDEVRN